MEITNLKRIGSWNDVLNAARATVGKEFVDKEPSSEWKTKILKAEHSPIRLLSYMWTWENIPYWVTVHLVRHHIGIEKFVSTSRPDRNGNKYTRHDLSQDALVNMTVVANAQAIINISRIRLCNKASRETRQAWEMFLQELKKVEPELVYACVPNCIYRKGCPEMQSCGMYDHIQPK